MLGRQLAGVRLSVVVRRSEVLPYLVKCGWSASTSEIEELLHRFTDADDEVQFDFDMGGGAIRPRLGIGIAPRDEAGWVRLLDQLVSDGLCVEAKSEALLGWPGASMAGLKGVGACVLRRELSHVKLTCGPNEPTEAKAYFGVFPRRSLFG
jgi:hypothetical protein